MLKLLLSSIFVSGAGWGEISLVLSVIFIFVVMYSPTYMSYSGYFYECDWISWNLVMLSVWIILLSIFSSLKIYTFNKLSNYFLNCMFFLYIFLYLTFMCSDFMMFYVMFESCLIPILFMILGWGYQPERCQAGVYMFFYTLFGSLPLFFVILYLSMCYGSSYMFGLNVKLGGGLLFLFLVGGFLVKFPMYGVHLWLLKAHVEAPVAGSMILAGVLLKLGGYGLIRFSMYFSDGFFLAKSFILVFSLWGAVCLSVVCLRFMDMKLLIAASSVVHMSTCICGIFIMSEWGIWGSMVMMVAHGLCSSGLFCLANLIYERTNSRSMFINKGLLSMLPVMSMWWFLLLVCNMSGPPSYNLVGEILLLISIVNWSNFSLVMLVFLGFFSAAYSLYLYSLSQHGVFVKLGSGFSSGKIMEYFVLFLHWLPLNIFMLGVSEIIYLSGNVF